MTYIFQSHFAGRIKGVLDYRSAMGRSHTSYQGSLASFDRFCLRMFPDESVLTRELAFAWCNSAIGSGTTRASIIRGFGRYLVSIMEEEAYIMPASFFPQQKAKLPHILSEAELGRFFEASDRFMSSIQNPMREYTISTVFRLMFALGLRPNEVRLLKRKDFNFRDDTIYVVDTKHGKDRRLPVNPAVMEMCKKYDMVAETQIPGRVYFFQSHHGNAYSTGWLIYNFHKCWEQSGNCRPTRTCTPYSLRHTFASHTLMRWIEEGKDVNAWMPYLAAYMGHDQYLSTYYYVQLLPERLAKMDFTDPKILPEVDYDEKI